MLLLARLLQHVVIPLFLHLSRLHFLNIEVVLSDKLFLGLAGHNFISFCYLIIVNTSLAY